MDPAEGRSRMQAMGEYLKGHDVFAWAASALADADTLEAEHRLVHDRDGFRLELIDGRPLFRRPDGTILEDRAPP